MPSNNFRDYLFPLDSPRLSEARSVSAREFGQAARQNPVVGPMIAEWDRRSREPFLGITTDGQVEGGLFRVTEGRRTHWCDGRGGRGALVQAFFVGSQAANPFCRRGRVAQVE